MCDTSEFTLDSKVLSNPDIRKIATKCARGETGVLLGTSVSLKKTMFQKNPWDYWECSDFKQKLEKRCFFVVLWHIHPRIMSLQMTKWFSICIFRALNYTTESAEKSSTVLPASISRLVFWVEVQGTQ